MSYGIFSGAIDFHFNRFDGVKKSFDGTIPRSRWDNHGITNVKWIPLPWPILDWPRQRNVWLGSYATIPINSKNIHNNYRVKLPLTSWFPHGFTGYLYIIPRFSIYGNIQFLERIDGYSDRVDVLNSQIFHISTGHGFMAKRFPFLHLRLGGPAAGSSKHSTSKVASSGRHHGKHQNNGEVMGNWHGKWWWIMAELWFNQKLEHKEGKCVVYLWFNHDIMISMLV